MTSVPDPATALLPEGFAELEPWVAAWALPRQLERSAARQAAPMEKITAFYRAMLPRLPEILELLGKYPAGSEIPQDVERLYHLSLSIGEIAPAVELFNQPGVPYGFELQRFKPTHEG